MCRVGVEVQLYSFFNFDTMWGWVVNATPWPFYTQERELVPMVQEAGLKLAFYSIAILYLC